MSKSSFFRRSARRLFSQPVIRQTPIRLSVLRLEERAVPAVTGVVYQDFNANGFRDTATTVANTGNGTISAAVDRGIAGVTVTAYDDAGAVRGTAVSDAFGAYTLNISGAQTDPLRVEFTTLPAGFSPAPVGPSSATSVQFLAGGAAANVNFGVARPEDYSQNNPLLATNVYQQGGIGGANADNPALIAAPYAVGGTSTANYPLPAPPGRNVTVPFSRIGAAFGLGWDRVNGDLYNSAYFKRHSGLGPNGTGAIYKVPVPANAAANYQPPAGSLLYADLNAIFGANTAGANLHNAANYDTDNGNAGWDAVGKTSLGGLDVSDDGRFIFVMNLADRQLYRVPTFETPTAANVLRVSIPLTNPDAGVISAARFRPQDLRPFAVEYHQGQVYVGAVYTAETLATGPGDQAARNELLAVVYRLDPATMTFEAAPRQTVRLNYTRSQSIIGFAQPGLSANWEPWRPTYFSTATSAAYGVAPQPMLSGITFDAQGNLTLGIRDRGADQIGSFNLSIPGNNTRVEGFNGGDLLRATVNTVNDLNSGWTLEGNARVPNNITAAGGTFGTGPQGNNSGPGGGEFYYTETFTTNHGETSMGGTAQLPGFPDVVYTNMDPGSDVRAGGWSFISTLSGNEVKAYQIYVNPSNVNAPLDTFGKANGLGELVALVGSGPREVGNRLWFDADGDGVQDPGEAALAGLSVELWDLGADGVAGGGDDTKLAGVVTDKNGSYYFSEAKNVTDPSYAGGLTLIAGSKYEVRIPNAEGPSQQAAIAGKNYVLTKRDADATAGGDLRDSDATLVGTTGVIGVTAGGFGVTNHSYDAGFARQSLSLGNFVWVDTNNNGKLDAGESGLAGVTVNLLQDSGVGFAQVATQQTGGAGDYLFTNLAAGTYRVEVAAPAGFVTSTGNGQASVLTRPGTYEPGVTGTQDSEDHGTFNVGTGTILGGVVTLNAAGNPDAAGNANLRQDFGLVRTFSLGNRVWLDANNNGKLEAGEQGIDGVVAFLTDAAGVAILDAAGNPLTATTAGGGYYRFDNLAPGDYRVRLAAADAKLAGLRSSTGAVGTAGVAGPFEPGVNPNSDTDNDDNGTLVGIFAQSGVVTLGPTATEPTGEADLSGGQGSLDAQANMTVDFGFFRPMSLGNRVWFDLDNSGMFNAGDTNAPAGVLLTLLDSTGNPVLNGGGTAVTSTTDANGYYLFTGLNPGQYKVAVAATNFSGAGKLVGYDSSTGGGIAAPTGPFEGTAVNQGDDNDSGNRSGLVVVSSTATLVNGAATKGEPAGPGVADPTADADSELTVDFGFVPRLSLGNRVFEDANNSGTFDAGDTPLANVVVRLLDAAGNPVTNGGGAITTKTNAQGYYLFDNLTPGKYVVEVVPPAGYLSSTGANGSVTGPNEPGVGVGNDDQDHGTAQGNFFGSTAIRSGVVNLLPGTATTGEGAGVGVTDGAIDGNSEQTLDFGLFRPLSLGNRVWIDANNNGSFEAGELPAAGVVVELLDAAGNPVVSNGIAVTTTTTADGFYLFTALRPGNYRVGIAAGNFAAGGPLTGFASSTGGVNGSGPFEPSSTLAGNNLDSGTLSGGRVVSAVVTLALGGQTTSDEGANGLTPGLIDPAADADSEVTVDFGFYQPLRLGNFVWNDANNNGVVDGGETGLGGVTLSLFRDSNGDGVPDGPTPLGTTTTGADGKYLFSGLGNDKYVVAIDPGTQPAGFWLSSSGKNGSPTGPNEPAPSPNGDVDNDDNGTLVGGRVLSGSVTLTPGGEPTADGDDANGNLTVDFGFYQPLSLGNFVWDDVNNNGKFDAGEQPLGKLAVTLYAADGKTVVGTTTTNATGNYLFTNLAAGGYIVEVAGPAGYFSSTGKSGFATGPTEPAPNPNGDTDGNDDGTGLVGGSNVVRSGLVTLSVGGEPTGEPATPGFTDATPDANSNLTVDFGLFRPLSLGNQVWLDADNNGKFDAGEKGVASVPVRLLDAAGKVVVTTATDADGKYLFTNLGAGDYRVEITAPLGFTSSSGQLSSPTGPFEPAPNDATNNDDAGTAVTPGGGVIQSGLVRLAPGLQPTDDGDADANTNLTIDFGILPLLSLGDLVWNDANNNGKFDGTEKGIAGVTVNLYQDADQDGVPDTAAPFRVLTTDANGNYLFTGLITRGYIVEVIDPAGFVPSSGKNGTILSGPYQPAPSPENDVNNDDNGTISAPGRVRSVTVVLTTGGEPTNDGDADPNTNRTVDFGYYRPLSLGDLVWNDRNNNGVVDAGEPGLASVPVRLFDAAGGLVGTTTTTADGKYSFTNLVPGSYTVEVDLPAGFTSSTGGVNGSGPYEAAPNPDNNVNNDDNGTTSKGQTVRSGPVTLTLGGEPTSTANPGDTNLTVDFGAFQPLSLGNLVWNDANNNGKLDGTEKGIAGVTVNLYRDANGDVPDSKSPLGTATTTATGKYLFTGLGTGGYVVEVVAPAGFLSSSGTTGSLTGPFEVAPSPANGVDGDDNGTAVGGRVIRSGTVNLAPGTAPTGEPATPGFTDGTPDASSNLTVDFGLYAPLSLGNLVWNDLNNNGVVDDGEPGIAGVPVRLIRDGVTVRTTTTDAAGGYLFTNLSPGDYVVELTPPAGLVSSSGGANGVGPFEAAPNPNGDVNNDDNGTLVGGVIRSGVVTLTAGGEPAGGGSFNPTVDLGLFQPLALGNLVFNDSNNNGKLDAGEAGVGGVRVNLYRDDDQNGVPDGAAIGSLVTTPDGKYLFTQLGAGSYVVEIDAATLPAGFASSSGTNGSLAGPFETAPGPNDDADSDDNGTTAGGVIRSGTVTLTLGGEPTNGDTNPTVDFGVFQPLSLGNTIFQDNNNNGILDPGEAVVPGIPVRLFDADGMLVASTTTGPDGTYQFINLAAGGYVVEITPPAGVLPSDPAFDPLSGGDNQNVGVAAPGGVIRSPLIQLQPGQAPLVGGNTDPNSYVTGDFGLLALATVSGYTYLDPDNNGTFNPGGPDRPLGGVVVTITGTDLNGDPIPARTTTTDANGFYQFSGLIPGTYTIRETQPGGILYDGLDTPGSLVGSSPGNDTLTVTLAPNQDGRNYNFGEVPPAAVFGSVYADNNLNGLRDAGDTGIPGVPVVISGTAFAGTPQARPLTAADVPGGLTRVTDAGGRYNFGVLPPGAYTLTEPTQPAGFLDTVESNRDPVATPTVGNEVIADINATAGGVFGSFDFGEIVPDPTKRQFLASTPEAQQATGPRSDMAMSPAFTVTTGDPTRPSFVVAGVGAGIEPLVRAFDYATGVEKFRFLAYEASFTGGVRVATGDFNGDGVEDIVTGTGVGGGPRIRVFDGRDGSLIHDFLAYEESFRGGLFLAGGDVNGDGVDDIVTGVDTGGGPRVRVLDGRTLAVIQDFFAFDADQRGGVRVATGDFNGDGRADIVATTGPGVPTLLRVIDVASLTTLREFAPFEAGFSGGVNIAAADLTGDGFADLITGAEQGGGPRVQTFDGRTSAPLASFFAYEASFTGGVRVAAHDVTGDGVAEVVTAPGLGLPGRVRVTTAGGDQVLDQFTAFDPDYLGSVYVG